MRGACFRFRYYHYTESENSACDSIDLISHGVSERIAESPVSCAQLYRNTYPTSYPTRACVTRGKLEAIERRARRVRSLTRPPIQFAVISEPRSTGYAIPCFVANLIGFRRIVLLVMILV